MNKIITHLHGMLLLIAMTMRRVVIKERQALAPVMVILLLNFVLLLCWTLVDPLVWQREPYDDDPSNSYGFCLSEGSASIAFLTLLILLDLSALVLACVQAYRARQLDDEFTDSRWLVSNRIALNWMPLCLLLRVSPPLSLPLYKRELHVLVGFKYFW